MRRSNALLLLFAFFGSPGCDNNRQLSALRTQQKALFYIIPGRGMVGELVVDANGHRMEMPDGSDIVMDYQMYRKVIQPVLPENTERGRTVEVKANVLLTTTLYDIDAVQDDEGGVTVLSKNYTTIQIVELISAAFVDPIKVQFDERRLD